MKTKSLRLKLSAILLCLVTIAACLSFVAIKGATAQEADFAENPFESTYAYGDTLVLPGSLDVVSGEKSYAASNSYLRFPDGTTRKGNSFELTNFGEYTVIYEATDNNVKYTASHTFDVKTATYTTGKESSYTLATLNSNFGNDVVGLSLDLAAGDTFTYNVPVNIYENPVLDLIRFNVMHFDPVGKEIVIRLTDCYDSSKYIDLTYYKAVYDETYLGVSANGKASRGITKYMNVSGQTIYIDGEDYKINSNGGLIPSNRQAGRSNVATDRYNNMSVSLDSTNKDKIRVYVKTAPETPRNELFAELNNPDIYNYTFDGFTTGEVFVSITAKTVVTESSAKIEIASLCGVSGEDLAGGFVTDSVGPVIKLDTEKTSLNVMAGIPVAVPTATAYDPSGLSGEVDYTVYCGYGTALQKNMSVKNGTFTPTDIGTYTVLYTAYDTFGNLSTKTFTFYAPKVGTEGIDFSCDKVENALAGTTVSLASYTALSLNSTATVSVSLTSPDGTAVKVASDMTALLEKTGTYTVKYDYSDDLYSGSYTYEFTAADGGIVRFEKDKIVAPKYMIKGATYSLDKINAYKYTASPSLASVDYEVSYDGGAYTAFNPESFTITGENTVKFRYKATETVVIESDEIKIVDVGYGSGTLDVSKYFVGSFAGSVSEDTSDRVSYNVTADGSLEFINPLLSSNFSIRYSFGDRAKVGSYKLVFTDYNDGKTATIEFVENGVKVNGVFRSATYDDTNTIMVSLVNGTLTVGSSSIDCNLGLSSDKVLFGLEFDGVTSATEFGLYSLCGQSFGYYITYDNVKPIISVEHPDRVAEIGDVITLASPDAVDVLSPSPIGNCTVSVYKDGNLVTSTSGVLLGEANAFVGYSFEITDFGSYLIVYEYGDGAGRKQDDRFVITVTDVVAPEIALVGYNGKPVSVGVNKEIKPVSFSVKDNVTATENIKTTVIVYSEKGVAVTASNGNFVLTSAGNYTVYIYCSDEAGNTAYVSYRVIAK